MNCIVVFDQGNETCIPLGIIVNTITIYDSGIILLNYYIYIIILFDFKAHKSIQFMILRSDEIAWNILFKRNVED